MAKKTLSKGKEKKLLRKTETQKAQQLKAFLAQLNEAGNLLEAYPAFTKYDRNGLAATLRFYRGQDLPQPVLGWAFALTKKHMQLLYEACPSWGWNDASKRQELLHPGARFICVFQQQPAPVVAPAPSGGPTAAAGEGPPGTGAAAGGDAQPSRDVPAAATAAGGQAAAAGALQEEQLKPLAFMHFRFEEEAGEAVLYLYEIQVDEAAQGKGLGKFLLQLLELVGRKSGVARLMLTVFHGNTAARALYAKLGYTLDEDSPSAVDPSTDATYDILTKWLKPRGS